MKIKFVIFSLCIHFAFAISLQSHEVEKVVIIGSGAAGSSAAIFTAQSNLNPLVIQDLDCKSQMALIHKIDNYPGLIEEIDGHDLLKIFRTQAKSYGARFVQDSVIGVDLKNKPFQIDLESGQSVFAESIIIASGTAKRWLELPNETALRGKGVVPASFCRETSFMDKVVVVVGGGHAALQEAHFVSEVAKEVILVNRSHVFTASKFHQEQVFNNPKIRVIYDTEVEDILGVEQDKVTGVLLRNKFSEVKESIDADLVLVAIGNLPNSELFKGQIDMTDTGKIIINGKNTSTNVPGVFAAGDVTDVAYGRVVIAAGAGGMAALDAIQYLAE